MTATTQLLYASPNEGSSVYIDYDSVTLIATGLTITCGLRASQPLILWFSVGGVTSSLQANLGAAIKTYTFPAALIGVAVTPQHGGSGISWGISSLGGGHGVVAPSVVAVL